MSTDKVYPPNQPKVFNPQNPNAPPIYPCGICHKEVHDNDQVQHELIEYRAIHPVSRKVLKIMF